MNREQIEAFLNENGMFFSGVAKEYIGKAELYSDTGLPIYDCDNFGYYDYGDGLWAVFVSDSERNTTIYTSLCNSEEEALEELFEMSESRYYIKMKNDGVKTLPEHEPAMIEYIKREYGYSDEAAVKALEYLKQSKFVAYEFLYYIEHGEFFPEKHATRYSDYTVQMLSGRDDLSLLGAFNYLIYIHKKPEEALANLKKGLPRRKVFSDKELKEVQLHMDEKTQNTEETLAQTPNGENVADEPATEASAPDTAESEGANGDACELAAKLEAIQQALAALQGTFDTKIAEDTHKNGLFDNMHRELIKYQNGALEKIVDTIALDIIQLVDTTKGHVRIYESKEPTEENYRRLLRIVKGIAQDLEDILYRQSIESYNVPGHDVDVRRQKIIQTVPTDDSSKDNRVAVRVADGYEKDGKVLRPERIKIFKYEAPTDTESTDSKPETPSEN